MLIGVISDTHDNLTKLDRAVSFFNKQKVSFVLHAGDYVAPFSVARLSKLASDWRGVFGNNDGDREALARASGNRIAEDILRVEIDGRKIVMAHDSGILDLKKETAQIVICGHTHKPVLYKQKSRLIINPGEACGWLSGVSTVAIIDLSSFVSKIHTL
jgi:putative phosphoesterase